MSTTPRDAPIDLPPGVTLGRFEVLERIGRGGMGEVFRGVHVMQKVPVAIKVMTAERARVERYRSSFRREVQAVARLDHPGVVTVFDHGEVDADAARASRGVLSEGEPYLVMELAARGTLAALGPPLPYAVVRPVLLELLGALAHAHARDVIHRDVKPANVLVAGDGEGQAPRVKLADFGLAHALDRDGDDPGGLAGTARYMAPEQFEGRHRDLGPWTDLYALGCVAWELLAGRAPFAGQGLRALAAQHLEAPAPPLPAGCDAPPALDAWLQRLLAKRPRDRFTFAADAARSLAQIVAGDRPAAPRDGAAADAGATRTLDGVTPASVVDVRFGPPPSPATAVARPLVDVTPALPSALDRARARSDEATRLRGTGLGLFGLRTIPLVDRDVERAALWDALRAVSESGRARAVVLHATAGTGKSRLAAWLSQRAHEVGGALTLEAAYGPTASPAHGLARMMARFFRCVGAAGPEVVARVEERLRAPGDRPGAWRGAAMIAAAGSGVDSDEARVGAQQAAVDRHRTLTAVLTRLGRERTALVWLDDVHQGLEALGLVEHALRADQGGAPARVLFVLTARDEGLAERPLERAAMARIQSSGACARVPVPPLAPPADAELVDEILGLHGRVAEDVVARAAGNPLFAVQLVGDWVQRGLLEVVPAGFALREGVRAELPDDLHALWTARVGRLLGATSGDTRGALEVAAALGREVDAAEWSGACEVAGVRAPPRLVDGLVREGLARRTEHGWAFIHGMLRESLERGAREGGRFPSHSGHCAAALRALHPVDAPALAERVAAHLLDAGDARGALERFLAAADLRFLPGGSAARDDVSSREARGALDLDAELRCVRRALDARAAIERADDVAAAAAANDALAALPGAAAWWYAAGELGATLTRQGRADEIAALCERLGAADASGGAAQVYGVVRVAIGTYPLGRGDLGDAALDRLAALGLDRSPDAAARGWVSRLRGARALYRGDVFGSLVHHREARDAFESAGDARSALSPRVTAANAALACGLFEEALGEFYATLAESQRLGAHLLAAQIEGCLGLTLARLGDLDGARERTEAAAALYAARGYAVMVSFTRASLARILVLAGDLDGAAREADAAAGMTDGVSPLARAWALAARAEVRARRGDARGAHDDAGAAMAILDAHGGKADETESAIRVARVEALLGVGDRDGARGSARAARDRLIERAAGITDPAVRRSFLEREPDNARAMALARALDDVPLGGAGA